MDSGFVGIKFKSKHDFIRLCKLVGVVVVSIVALASLGISLWNSVDQLSLPKFKSDSIMELEVDVIELNDRMIELQSSVDANISALEATIETDVLMFDQSELEGRIRLSINDSFSELERRLMQLQDSYISELERRIQMNINDNITELERRITQVQNSVDELANLRNSVFLESERRLQRSINDSIFELETIIQLYNSSIPKLQGMIKIQNDSILSIKPSINVIQQFLIHNFEDYPFLSCSSILLMNRNAPNDYYWIRLSNGSFARVYCDFNRHCGCGGNRQQYAWTRVAFLNMSDPSHVCPENWITISSPVRTCGRGHTKRGGCDSTFYSTLGMTYRRVCGRVIAYQYGGTPAFFSIQSYSINGKFISGVSLTNGGGSRSRQHIWSFVSAQGEGSFFQELICPCSSTDEWTFTTSFVRNDYFCDSGNEESASSSKFYSDDPLWDGQGCGPSSSCCQFNNPPWFCKTLTQSTSDDLEVRICKNADNEDIPIQLIELYVQ